MFSIQIIAYVSQVHKVVLPENLVNDETVTLEQVHEIFIFLYFLHITNGNDSVIHQRHEK